MGLFLGMYVFQAYRIQSKQPKKLVDLLPIYWSRDSMVVFLPTPRLRYLLSLNSGSCFKYLPVFNRISVNAPLCSRFPWLVTPNMQRHTSQTNPQVPIAFASTIFIMLILNLYEQQCFMIIPFPSGFLQPSDLVLFQPPADSFLKFFPANLLARLLFLRCFKFRLESCLHSYSEGSIERNTFRISTNLRQSVGF
jgi:hypothetical protein